MEEEEAPEADPGKDEESTEAAGSHERVEGARQVRDEVGTSARAQDLMQGELAEAVAVGDCRAEIVIAAGVGVTAVEVEGDEVPDECGRQLECEGGDQMSRVIGSTSCRVTSRMIAAPAAISSGRSTSTIQSS